MRKLLSLVLIVLLIVTTGCKKALEQDETGALLPPEVLEEQTEGVDETQEQAESADETKEQTDAEKPSQVLPEEQPSADSSGEKNSGNAEPQEQASNIKKTIFNEGKNRAWTPVSLSEFSRGESICAEYIPTEHLVDIQAKFLLNQYIVFKGVKHGLSTPIDQYHGLWKDYIPSHCETNLLVSEVFYGDIRKGDVITFSESIKVYELNGTMTYSTWVNEDPIIEDEEYIFILQKSNQASSKDTALYKSVGMHCSSHKISEYESFKAKVQDKTARNHEILGFEALDYYLNRPQTKLDLRKEALQYVENIPEDATEEEILQALPEDKKDLFDRMIKQYGTVTAEKNENTQKVTS